MRQASIKYRALIAYGLLIILLVTDSGSTNAAPLDNPDPKRIAIVIDDFGNNMLGTEEMLKLPFPLTVAVMPFLSTTKRDAEWAHRLGHEVFVHMPMEPLRGKASWLGPGAITTDLSNEEIKKRVNAAFENVPYAVGISNHMGSKATADVRVMRAVMEVCRDRGKVYLDSHTTYFSVVEKVAREMGVPYIQNNLFLDNQYSKRHIAKKVYSLHDYLKTNSNCIAIGHVGIQGKKTASVLKENSSFLKNEGKLVTATQLMDPNYHVIGKRERKEGNK
ncbi:divergent polysaccharide deacetylase family protein [Brevibacillus ginsengisoli]|uniref:divergent polysaccharide deacetylase family protein n=1 Tax=Brevibacillus ginsengisoli TaxID=363854 RepID=UPI003CE7FA31